MFTRFTHLGRGLALLAVCLQMAAVALDGRICLGSEPRPASNGCVTECCDEIESLTSSLFAEQNRQPLLIGPTDTDCCLQIATNGIAAVAGIASVKTPAGSAPLLHAPAPSILPLEIAICRVGTNALGATQPPPSMPMIRSTVLRL